MRLPLHSVIAAAGLSLAAFAASADTPTVLNFEDLPASGPFGSLMPSGYGGIDWQAGNWTYLTCDVVAPCPGYIGPNDYYPYQAHSYPNMVTVDSTYGTSMQFGFKGGPAVFNGAWISTWDYDYFGYVLKLNGNVVYTTPLATTGSAPTYVASGYSGKVDQVVIIASDIGDWGMDDLSYTTTSAVPEPASAPMLLGGLGLMLGRLVRRRC
jgi:hypothetical protein